MKTNSLLALLLTCVLAAMCLAGTPEMPPAPTPEDQSTSAQPAPTPSAASRNTEEDTLPDGAVELLITAITSLFTSAP